MKKLLVLLVFLLPSTTLASLGPAQTITQDGLRAQYASSTLKILIVPGHDPIHWGTQFILGKTHYKEGDLTLLLGFALQKYLSSDTHIQTAISRERDGSWASWLTNYVNEHDKDVWAYQKSQAGLLDKAASAGTFTPATSTLHNLADPDTRTYLFAINKYANDNHYDLVIHIHFDDYGGRPVGAVGPYTGYTIFVPDTQFSSAEASKAVAQSLRSVLDTFMPGSSLPSESGVIVPDQNLIAVGEDATRDGASILTEYSYIYEPQIRSAETRKAFINELAHETYLGIEQFFSPSTKTVVSSTFLPHIWNKGVAKGTFGSLDIMSAQYALTSLGYYPPPGKTFSGCAISGVFGNCTKTALLNFQVAKLGQGTGAFGPATRNLLNKLFGK